MIKRIRIKDKYLREITDNIYNLKYQIRKERKKNTPDTEEIHRLELEIDRLEKERVDYYDEHYRDNPITMGARDGWTNTPETDAQIAKELFYPESVVQALMNEPDREKRQKILTNARNGIY